MKNICGLMAILVLCFGCGAGNDGAPENNNPNATKNPPVVNDPAGYKEGGSYIVKPANPDDPRFKMDPKLSGGN